MRCSVATDYLRTHHSPLTTHHSPLTTHHSPLTTHHSPLTTRPSPLTTHPSPRQELANVVTMLQLAEDKHSLESMMTGMDLDHNARVTLTTLP